MITVLIVDDSPTSAQFLAEVIDDDPELQVIGRARNGMEGVRLAAGLKPDVIVMDIAMPVMDGYEATMEIMSTAPRPIVIVSSLYNRQMVAMSFKALEYGALAIQEKLPSPASADYHRARRELLTTLKSMAGVKVVRRTRARQVASPATTRPDSPRTVGVHEKILAIGASTGGPDVIKEILSGLPGALPLPVVIVQHITPGFEEGMAEWLKVASGLPVSVVLAGERFQAGRVYLAGKGAHLEVSQEGRAVMAPGPPECGVCPSVSRFFRSVAGVYGKNAIGVLLTGMGRDGADGLKMIRDAGGITIAQDKESSVVHGMPGEAIRLGGACHVLSRHEIAAKIVSLLPMARIDRGVQA